MVSSLTPTVGPIQRQPKMPPLGPYTSKGDFTVAHQRCPTRNLFHTKPGSTDWQGLMLRRALWRLGWAVTA